MKSIGCKFSIIVNARRNCFVHRRMVHHRLVINAELVCVEQEGLTVVMRASNGRLFYGQSSDYALKPKRCLPLQRQTMLHCGHSYECNKRTVRYHYHKGIRYHKVKVHR